MLEHLNYALKGSFGSPLHKLVMISIAERMDQDGLCAADPTPIAAFCGTSPEIVSKAIRRLADMRFLVLGTRIWFLERGYVHER